MAEGRKIVHAMQDHAGGCTREQSEKPGLWEAVFVVSRERNDP